MSSARFTHSNGDAHRVLRVQSGGQWQPEWKHLRHLRVRKPSARKRITGEQWVMVLHAPAIPTTQQWHYVCFHHFSVQINISKLIKNFRWNWRMQRPAHVYVSIHSAYCSLHCSSVYCRLFIRHPCNSVSTKTNRKRKQGPQPNDK